MTSTITAPAAAARDPNRRFSRQEGPTAARRAIEAGTLTPAFHRLALAYVAADDAYQGPALAHTDAENAVFKGKLQAACLPMPEALVFRTRAGTCSMEGGESFDIPSLAIAMTTREDVFDHIKNDESTTAAALAALAEHQRQEAELDEASGWAALVRHEEETQAAESAASQALYETWMTALRHPTDDPADLAVKEAMIRESLDVEEFEPIAAMLEATLTALRQSTH